MSGDQERARTEARLDDDGCIGEGSEQSCALHDPEFGWCTSGRDLAEEGAAGCDAVEEFLVASRVGFVQTTSQDGDGLPARAQRAPVGGGVDTIGASANDGAAMLNGPGRKLGGDECAVAGRGARSRERDELLDGRTEGVDLAEHPTRPAAG